ncbi:MAG: tetratricopeptide repeat protein [Candidatus Methylumidiphilus sp.]
MLFTSFESHTDLTDALNQIGHLFAPVLQANGIEWHALNYNQQRRTLVLQLLRQIPLLWIWDNVELVAGFPAGTESAWTKLEQTDLAEFLKQVKLDKSTKVKILLTSRRDEQNWLGGIAQRIKMPRMSHADAATLALELGKERNLNRAELADWQPLLNYCAGNPLTLRIIVGQAVSLGLRGESRIAEFIQAMRDGEQRIADADEAQGRDRSLGASLDYGFRHAFKPEELPVIALLHLFQGVVDVDALEAMGKGEYALAELRGGQIVGANSFAQISDMANESAQMPDEANEFAPTSNVFDKAHLTHLLQRATETGLLTHLGETWYTIHPALPWFLRQVFALHYDGKDGRSTAEAALRAWVEAIGALGDYYHDQFGAGNQGVIQFLALEEANLLHCRRLARSHGWWGPVTSAMQGLWSLYQYQGRGAEWARLVDDIVPDYCSADDEPISGREDDYSLVMGYRVRLAQQQDRDLSRAAALQNKLVAWVRLQAADALALPEDAALDTTQRHRIRTLGVSVHELGQILMEQNDSDCVKAYQETIRYDQRIADTAAEAIAHFNLGHAYKDIPAIRDLDKAEAAYQRSLDLWQANDAQNRAKTIQQIGMVQHNRFREARERNEPEAILLKHLQAAEAHYLQALKLCPANAITQLGPLHNQLGNLYREVGQTEQAREHYEKGVQLAEQTGDRYRAGTTRYNMALMYWQSANQQDNPAQRRDLLHRAKAYAEAALRDFQTYQGRAANEEAKAQQLITAIGQALA